MIDSINQQPSELLNTFISIYRKVYGDEYEFCQALFNDDNKRFKNMTSFELELMYKCVSAIVGNVHETY